jgi:F-type H+-transporting ATPase subunit delta
VDAFRGLCDEKRGVVRAKVRTARPLNEVAIKDLAMRLGELLGHRVEIESGVSPALLGGVELRMGSTVYDGTVAGALKALHQDLVKG